MGNNENVTAQLVSQPYLISEFVLQGYVLTSMQNFESTLEWWQTIAIKAQDERKKIRRSRPINYPNREAKHANNNHNNAASLFPNSIWAVYCTEFHPKRFQKKLMAIKKQDLSIGTNFEQFCENGIDPIVENRAGERWTGCRPLHAQSIHYTRSTPPRVWRFSATRIHSLFDFVSSSWTKVGYMRRAGARATVQGCKTMCPQDLEDTPSCWRVLLISYFSPS